MQRGLHGTQSLRITGIGLGLVRKINLCQFFLFQELAKFAFLQRPVIDPQLCHVALQEPISAAKAFADKKRLAVSRASVVGNRLNAGGFAVEILCDPVTDDPLARIIKTIENHGHMGPLLVCDISTQHLFRPRPNTGVTADNGIERLIDPVMPSSEDILVQLTGKHSEIRLW